MQKLILITLLISVLNGLYTSSDDVIELTSGNFNSLVKNSNDIWFIEFYAPWCGHCQSLAPEYKKLARSLKGIVKVGAVDLDKHKNLGGPYNIKGFPTLKFFGENKNSPKDYNQARSAQSMLSFVLDEIRSISNSRLSGNGNRSNNNNQSNNNSQRNNASGDKNVILNSGNFDKEVINQTSHVYMILFYAPWCGHCKNLMPDWNRFSNLQDKTLKVGKVDCTTEKSICDRYQVQGFPTIKGFGPSGIVEEYNSGRDYESLDTFSKVFKNKHFKKKVEQLNDHSLFEDECITNGNICLVGFLPHILDSSKEERAKYIRSLQNALERNIGKKIFIFWVQGGDNFDLEEKLYLGSGYPTMIALYHSKKKYSVMRGSFTEDSIHDFIGQLFRGKAHLNDYKEIPKWKKVDKYVN